MSHAVANLGTVKIKRPNVGRRIGMIAGGIVLVLVALGVAGAWYMSYVPDDLDLSTTLLTEHGHYQVSYEPSLDTIPINELHAWTLHVATPDGEPVDDATIAIDGDMPQHGHGLPTRPQVTENLGGGRYLVEGVKFQMGGWWVMDFAITAGGHTDQVRFNFILR